LIVLTISQITGTIVNFSMVNNSLQVKMFGHVQVCKFPQNLNFNKNHLSILGIMFWHQRHRLIANAHNCFFWHSKVLNPFVVIIL
jgi:hypothetical protein